MKFKFNNKPIPFYILAIFGALLFFMGIANHYYFRSVTYDYGAYNFGFWDYANLRISPSPLYPGTFLQDHYSFTLMYFVPVFWLFNWLTGTYTLILIQYTMILVAAWYSYKLVMLKSKNLWLGIGMMFYYFVLLGRYTTFSSDCNIAVISACFVPVFLFYFELKKYIHALVILILSLFSRENIPIWFVFIFLTLIIEHRKDKKAILFSVVGILVSILYFVLLFKVLIPSIETPEKQFALFNYGALGKNPGEAFNFIVHHPVESVKMLFVNHLNDPAADGIKSEFYWVYLLSGGVVLFLRPKYLIWFIPLIAQKMLNDNYIRWGISNYYSIEVVTMLPLSVFLAISEIKWKYLRYGLAIATCLTTVIVTLHKLEPRNVKVIWTTNPARERIYDKDFFNPPFNIKKVNQLLSEIPDDARVSSCDRILPHLAQRQSIYLFPEVKDAEYIVFSMYIDNWLLSRETNDQKRNEYLMSSEWEIVAKEFPVVLLRKYRYPNDFLKKLTLLKKNTIKFDFEKSDSDNTQSILSSDSISNIDGIRDSLNAYEGKYSIKISNDQPEEFSYILRDISNYSFVEVSVWRKSPDGHGQIVASLGDKFVEARSTAIEKRPDGWEKLLINFLVPEGVNAGEFKVNLSNKSPSPVNFDNVMIRGYK
jgi:uncharacterized membrane protein